MYKFNVRTPLKCKKCFCFLLLRRRRKKIKKRFVEDSPRLHHLEKNSINLLSTCFLPEDKKFHSPFDYRLRIIHCIIGGLPLGKEFWPGIEPIDGLWDVFRSACWVSRCLLRSTFRWNARPQSSQANGLKPVCFLECVIRLLLWENALPHTWHLCGFSPETTNFEKIRKRTIHPP